MKIIQKFMIGYIILFFAISAVIYDMYKDRKELEISKIDKILYEAALSINRELKKGFHDTAVDKNSITKEEHDANSMKLTYLRRNFELIYLYTAVERNGKIYLTSSSITDIDLKNRNAAEYFYYYDDASSDLKKAMKEERIIFSEYTDKEGSYRALFIPIVTEGGRKYILAAEKDIRDINNMILVIIIKIGAITLFLYILLFILIADYLNKSENKKEEIKRINEELEKKYIVKQQEAEEAKQKLIEMNKTKDRLFSIIGHDIKGTIGNLMSIAEFMSENGDKIDGNNRKQIFDSIKKSVENAYFLAVNLFEWAKIQRSNFTINPEIIRVKEVLEKEMHGFEERIQEKEIDINLETKNDLFIVADRANIELVLKNILSNSIKYSREKGKIKIMIEKNETEAIIIIKDNGEGMKDDKVSSIFEFYDNKFTYGTKGERGAGLGMIVCKELIERNGGRIEVESKIEEGSEFKLYFPMN